MSRKNILIGAAVVIVAAAVIAANVWYQRKPGTTVTVEAIKARDLEAIVSASGKIQPKRLVNISADTSGRVVNLAVNEGDRIKRGQFLLQIDPKSLRTRVDSGTASLEAAVSEAVPLSTRVRNERGSICRRNCPFFTRSPSLTARSTTRPEVSALMFTSRLG